MIMVTLVAVSSDRALIDEAKRQGIPFVVSSRMDMILNGEEDEGQGDGRQEKKGNPRKVPKGVRKAHRAINKM